MEIQFNFYLFHFPLPKLNLPTLQEPKLSAARRIVAEWTDYDEEMARLGDQITRDKRGEREEARREKKDEL